MSPTQPSTDPEPVAGAAAERGSDGRFIRGNTIGRSGGRPPKEVEREYLLAFTAGCPANQLERIVQSLANKAESGNVECAKLLLRYALPAQAVRLELAKSDEEFRVAGIPPSELRREMMGRILDGVAELHKSKLAKSSSKPRRSSSKKKSKPKPKKLSRTGK